MIKVIDTKAEDSCYCQAYIREHPEDRFLIVVSLNNDMARYLALGRVKQPVEQIDIYFRRYEDDRKIEKLIEKNVSMIINHSEFERLLFKQEVLDALREKNYTLILDGKFVHDRPLNPTTDPDLNSLYNYFQMKIEDDLSVTWDDRFRTKTFGDIMWRAKAHNLYQKEGDPHIFICRFPLHIFEYFKDVMILVKGFNNSKTKPYLKKNGIEYELLIDPRRSTGKKRKKKEKDEEKE